MALTFLEFCNRYHDSPPAAAAALPNVICFARPCHLSLAERVTAGMGARERVSVCAWSCRGAAGMVECVRVCVCACIAAALCACLRMHVRAFTAPAMVTGGLYTAPAVRWWPQKQRRQKQRCPPLWGEQSNCPLYGAHGGILRDGEIPRCPLTSPIAIFRANFCKGPGNLLRLF